MAEIQAVPIIIDHNVIYKLAADGGGFRLRSGGDLVASDHCLVAIRAAGLDQQQITRLLAEYLSAGQENDHIYREQHEIT